MRLDPFLFLASLLCDPVCRQAPAGIRFRSNQGILLLWALWLPPVAEEAHEASLGTGDAFEKPDVVVELSARIKDSLPIGMQPGVSETCFGTLFDDNAP